MKSILNTGQVTSRKRNHLPHLDLDGGIYFVTFCLLDAITPELRSRHRAARDRLRDDLRKRNGRITAAESAKIDRQYINALFAEMDRAAGLCVLRDPRIARIVVDSLRCFDKNRYRLYAYCVMPNHVHAAFRAFEGHVWWRTVGSWKSFTAKQINRLTKRQGSLWQDDNFDRLVRDTRHLERVIRYIGSNPSKAGLDHWPWVEQLIGPPFIE